MSGGLVGIIANDTGRYSQFAACVTQLERPSGSRIEWLLGGDWCEARNTLARMVLEDGDPWLWFMDDDHTFHSGMLLQLLSGGRPLVMPLCLTRNAPFGPTLFTERVPDAEKQYVPINLQGRPNTGLVELQAGGCAGMLIRREVLEAIEPPWFEYADRSEDIIFCEKAKEAGFPIYCDLGARLGHITTAVVEPSRMPDGTWVTGLTVGKGMRLVVPFDVKEEEE